MYIKPLLILSFAVAGLVAGPAGGRATYKTASASGFGPEGSQYASNPNGVYISGPGYYAGASTTTSGAAPFFSNFPAFPAFPSFPYYQNNFRPNAYAPSFPFDFSSMFQMYLNALAQNTAAIASAAKPSKYTPSKYTAPSYDGNSASFSFPYFPGPSSPSSSAFGFPLVNRFGEESTGVGSGISSTSHASKPGNYVGVFSSSAHGSTNLNGKEESYHISTTGVDENGKVTTFTVKKP